MERQIWYQGNFVNNILINFAMDRVVNYELVEDYWLSSFIIFIITIVKNLFNLCIHSMVYLYFSLHIISNKGNIGLAIQKAVLGLQSTFKLPMQNFKACRVNVIIIFVGSDEVHMDNHAFDLSVGILPLIPFTNKA